MAVFDPKRMKAKLSQGVNTVVVGNCVIRASPSPLARHSALIPPLDLLGDDSEFRFTTTGDYMEALADVFADVDDLWTTHMCDERSIGVAVVAETIDIARRSVLRTLVSLHKCFSESAFGVSQTTLSMISKARDELRLDLDVYPDTASSRVLNLV